MKNVVRKKRGRPATGQDPVTAIRLSPNMRSRVDAWAAKQDDAPSRSEAIRRLVELGLAGTKPVKRTSSKSAAKAAGLAGEMVDLLGDQSATPDDRAKRKRRLLKGPSEFREMREDHPKGKPSG
jgi:Arc/MetJ-type ribon-helix-helix transcriptional regulator